MKKILLTIVIALLFSVPFLLHKEANDPKIAASKCEFTINLEGQQLPLEEYVKGVVAAEMPAAYELEALKAQALAARTYALYKQRGGDELKASTAHQVFYNPSERQQRWHDNFKTYEAKIEKAVNDTKGQIITYSGQPISAMFHAASNGQTEAAKHYSGHDVPYLKSVPSPENEQSKMVVKENEYSVEKLLNAKLKRNESGRVQQVEVAGQSLTGRALREQLQLRSTDFQFKLEGGELIAITNGYGHGVGMSQQGANVMAKAGAKADEIIHHYYTNVKIEKAVCKS